MIAELLVEKLIIVWNKIDLIENEIEIKNRIDKIGKIITKTKFKDKIKIVACSAEKHVNIGAIV